MNQGSHGLRSTAGAHRACAQCAKQAKRPTEKWASCAAGRARGQAARQGTLALLGFVWFAQTRRARQQSPARA